MPFTATQLQVVLEVVRHWYLDSFQALKVQGQYAICDTDPLIAYVSKYCCAPEIQSRGHAHRHVLRDLFREPWSVTPGMYLNDVDVD